MWDFTLGAIIALMSAGLAEWNARRREREQRLHEDRRHFRTLLVEQCRVYFEHASRVLAVAEIRRDEPSAVGPDMLKFAAEAGMKASDAHGWLVLLAPENIRAAVSYLNNSMPDRLLSDIWLPEDANERRRVSKGVRDAIEGLIHAVRVEVGVAK